MENARGIKKDLLYEWVRIKEIITSAWTTDEEENWEMTESYLLKDDVTVEQILLPSEKEFDKPKK